MIPPANLKAQYESLKEEIQTAVLRTLESGHYVLGPEVAEFEKDFAAFQGARFGIGVNSGTSALHLALLALGIGPGDEVITTPFTFTATVAAILYAGAKPVFVDMDPDSFTMNPSEVAKAVTPKTRAVIPVHLYGQSADLDPILKIANHHGLKVIEDAAQAHGALYKNKSVGGIGEAGCFSFYPAKNLGACGEGGIVLTSDEAIAKKIRLLRNWGEEKKYDPVLKGYNYRMEAVQGAVLRVKLRRLAEWNRIRCVHAERYDALLKDTGAGLPKRMPYSTHVFHVYAIRVRERDRLLAYLNAREVGATIHYPIPVHLQRAYSDLGYRRGDFPHAEKAAAEVLSLPVYPELSAEDIEFVAGVVREGLGGTGHS
jgi:dTDP-4-amino-4,6-dideoxygalactose transaminase